jgi:hypothetical protein
MAQAMKCLGTGRRCRTTTAAALLCLAAGGALLFVRARPWGPPDPVYTVAQVAAGLRQQSQAWEGRTVTVRGVAVLIEWAIQHHGLYMGVARAGCVSAACTLSVPTNTWLDVFLVGQGPHSRAAAREPRLWLAAAQSGQVGAPSGNPPNLVPSGSPPNLVVAVIPQRLQLTWNLLHVVPRPLLDLLVQAPGIGYTLAPSTTMQVGTTYLYRIQLWSAAMTGRCGIPACNDGELLNSP